MMVACSMCLYGGWRWNISHTITPNEYRSAENEYACSGAAAAAAAAAAAPSESGQAPCGGLRGPGDRGELLRRRRRRRRRRRQFAPANGCKDSEEAAARAYDGMAAHLGRSKLLPWMLPYSFRTLRWLLSHLSARHSPLSCKN